MQGRASHIQRTFLIQNTEVNAGDRARRIAEADHQTTALQTVQRRFPRVFPHRVIHHAHFFAAGDLLQPLNNALFTIVNHLPGARLQRALRFLCISDGADQLRAQRLCPLTGDEPDATRCGMEQELLVGLNFIGFAQQVVNRQTFQERGRRLLKGDGVRQQGGFIRRNVVDGAVSAQRRLRVHHAVALFNMLNRAAHFDDDPGCLGAQAARH